MVVELAGLPGTGKTTTVRHLMAAQPWIRSAVVGRTSRKELIAHRVTGAREALTWGLVLMRWSDKQTGSDLVKRRIRQDLMSLSAFAQQLILEEGVVHHVWRTLFLNPSLYKEPWPSLVRARQPLVVLELGVEELRARTAGKLQPGRVTRSLAASTNGAEWDQAINLLDEILDEAGRHREIVRVDTSGPLAESASRVLRAIEAVR